MQTGDTKYVTINGTKSKVSWYSSKSSVASVSSNGKIIAKAPGTAVITGSVAGKKLTCKVNVKSPIKINNSSATLETGNTTTLKITGTTSRVSWSSSKSSVASVSSSGKVTAKAPGSAVITASVAGKKLTSKITVKTPIKISSSTVTIDIGKTKTLSVSGTSSKVTWTSSKPSVASVTSSGKITAKATGSTTITASVAGKKLTAKVTVTKPIKVVTPTPVPTPVTKPTPTPIKPAPTQSTNIPTPANNSPTPTPTIEAPKTSDTSYTEVTSGSKVIGYYAAWARYSGFSPNNLDASKLTHINYAFANIDSNHKVVLGYPDIDPSNISQLNALKVKYPHLKTIIAIGGWSWSGRFSDVAFTESSRKAFAQSAVEFIVKYGFDGIDIDWEYPVSGGLSTNIRRPEDKQNFTLLLKELREALDARGNIDQKHYLLSFAGAAGEWYVNNVELSKVDNYVDYANLMTYDIHGTWDQNIGFNAPLYSDPTNIAFYKPWSVDLAVQTWLNAGFPKEKLIMGVPFYGFIYQNVPDINHGLYQTFRGGASITYGTVASYYLNKPGFQRYFHETSKAPWLYDGTSFITYEDEESMAYKAQYIKSKGLGGAMIWELSQDPSKVLLNSLYQTLK